MLRKINIAVLMGGRTAEHEVSLNTGRVIVNALDKTKYNVKPIVITKKGKWLIPGGYMNQLEYNMADVQRTDLVPLSAGVALDRAVEEKIDVVFIAMHGPLGEDGTVQGLLELADIPYTGSNVLASSLAMHKMMSRKVFIYEGLTVPKSIEFNQWEWERDAQGVITKARDYVGFPCVLKPMELGSSVGISIARTESDFEKGALEVLKYSNEILVEEYIAGREVTCAVLDTLGGGDPIPLVPTEIIPKTREFFDYEAKYDPNATDEVTPPHNMNEDMIRRIQETAICAHKALRCEGMSRTDMIIRDDIIYVLELNTIPGMTEVSLYPKAAKAAGISFPELIDRIIQIAIENHSSKKRFTER